MFGIVPGCDYAEPKVTGEQAAAMPVSASYCGELPPQWVLNIGGLILQCHVDGTCQTEASDRKATEANNESNEIAPQSECKAEEEHSACAKSPSALKRDIAELKKQQSNQIATDRQADKNKKIAELKKGTGVPPIYSS